MTPENKEHFVSEKEAIFLLLTGIGDDIYSTVDACKTANKMWIAIERLQQAQWDKDMQKNCTLLAKYFKKLYKPTNNNLRTSSNSKNKTEDTIPSALTARDWPLAKECKKPKRVKDYSYHKEKMMMCKQAKQGVPLQAEQADWLADTDEEIDEQELEAHYSFMAKNSGECADERDALANLIANLTLDTEENKMILKQLKKANASLTQELEDAKTNLDELVGLWGGY
ncbi:hypothetical protein Tco_1143155 [Tanacetum coccineum]